MRRREALDVFEDGSVRILVETKQQEIADGALIQFVRHGRVQADAAQGVAEDQLVSGERKKLDTVLAEQDFTHSDRADPSQAKIAKLGKALGVHYIITGSITKFGGEENDKGGSLKGIHLGLGKHKTEVEVSARLVDTTTGEVLAAAKGHGESKKGGKFAFSRGGTGYGQSQSDFKASAIGEAQEMAANDLAQKIVAKKDRLN